MKILIVDDEPHLRSCYRAELESDGYEIREAASACEALQILSQQQIDEVVTDLRLPDMNGLQLISEILSVRRHIPIIIHTAYPDFRRDFHCWGAEAFVTKSSDLSALKYAIARHVATIEIMPSRRQNV